MAENSRASRSIASRSRISIASRSTCSTTRASTCSRCRAGSRRRPTTRTRRCRPPTSSIRRSGCRRGRGHAHLRPVPRDPRDQSQPGRSRRGVREYHKLFAANVNTYASLYNGVLQRDWFHAQARDYKSTLEAALHGNNIPTAVVENLIETTKAGTEPLRRYHRLRKRVARPRHLSHLRHDDSARRLRSQVSVRARAGVAAGVGRAARPRLPARSMRDVLGGRRGSTSTRTRASGAARTRRPCTACIPYMLLNYNDTLDAVFTLAHEMGHSMHTLLSNAHQPFVYSAYTIFVAEVPSTLSEALFLEYMLDARDRRSRADRAAAARDRRHRRRRSTRRCCSRTTSCRRTGWSRKDSR